MKPQTVDLFAGSFGEAGSVNLPDGISFAGNYFQHKLIGIFNPVFSVSFLYDQGIDQPPGSRKAFVVHLRHGKPLRNLLISVLFLFGRFPRKHIDRVLMYNFNIYYVPLFIFFRFLARKKVVLVIADAPFLVKKNLLNRLLQRLVLSSTGLVTLRHIGELNGRHSKSDVIPGIITRALSERTKKKAENSVLMSGSLGHTTGLLPVLKFFAGQDKYKLFITGKPYLMSQAEFDGYLAQYRSGSVSYLGALRYEEYTDLLSTCEFGLALRDPADIEHDYNFPSKIIEYMYCATIVITSLEYPELDRSTYFTAGFSPEGLKDCFDRLGQLETEQRQAHTENARKKIYDLCAEERIREKVEKMLYDK